MTNDNPHLPIILTDPDERIIGLRCEAEGCEWLAYGAFSSREQAEGRFAREHSDQYGPGRVPDIAPEWVLSVACSLCADGGSVTDDGETLICGDCGSTWYRDGTYGEKAAVEP